MDDLRSLRRFYKRNVFVSAALMLAGLILFVSDLGIHAWLLGLGLVLYATTRHGFSSLALEVLEVMEALRAAEPN
jgi:hypothetical protein